MATIEKELLGLLEAATGEPSGSMHSNLGRWRQRVGKLLQQVFNNGGGAASKTWAQTEYSEGGGQTTVGPGTDIIFDNVAEGNIPYDNTSGEFTLQAGKTYRLSANFVGSNFSGETVNVGIEWVDASTNTVLRAGHTALLTPVTNTNDINFNPSTEIFHAVGGTAQTVKLRVTTSGGTVDLLGGLSFALVQEV